MGRWTWDGGHGTMDMGRDMGHELGLFFLHYSRLGYTFVRAWLFLVPSGMAAVVVMQTSHSSPLTQSAGDGPLCWMGMGINGMHVRPCWNPIWEKVSLPFWEWEDWGGRREEGVALIPMLPSLCSGSNVLLSQVTRANPRFGNVMLNRARLNICQSISIPHSQYGVWHGTYLYVGSENQQGWNSD